MGARFMDAVIAPGSLSGFLRRVRLAVPAIPLFSSPENDAGFHANIPFAKLPELIDNSIRFAVDFSLSLVFSDLSIFGAEIQDQLQSFLRYLRTFSNSAETGFSLF